MPYLKKIEYDRKKFLGRGTYGIVYLGTFQNRQVAVKRIPLVNIDQCIEEMTALKRLDHDNVVRLLHVEEEVEFRLYAFDLCTASLDKAFLPQDHPEKYQGVIPSKFQMLYQLAKGLLHIHLNNLVHRDIKPSNVLISTAYWPVKVKWADFGLSKTTHSGGKYTLSGVRGTATYIAPEMLNAHVGSSQKSVCDQKSDIFSSGILFFEILADGEHPFGSKSESSVSKMESNVRKGKAVNFTKLQSMHSLRALIEQILQLNPEKRISADELVLRLNKKLIYMLNLCSLQDPRETEVDQLVQFVREGYIDDDNIFDEKGITPLLLLCWKSSNPSLRRCIEEILKDQRVDVNYTLNSYSCQNYNDYNALQLLCKLYAQDDLIDIVRLLINKEINVNYQNRGWTALHNLCFHYPHPNLLDIVRLLIEKGIDVTRKTLDGWTPLHFLCRRYIHENLFDIVQLLINHGVDVNAATRQGYTALRFLRENNYYTLHAFCRIELLLMSRSHHVRL